jgi:hypothetical protein
LNEYGLVFPILVDAQRRVIAGWGLVAAAQQIGLVEVPTVTISDLTEVQLRSLRLALNRLCEDASWDDQALRLEFSDLITLDPQVDLQMTGFAMGQIDSLLSSAEDEEDDLPEMHADPITKPGDMWILGEQRVFCADATQAGSFVRLLKDEQAQTVFADPPYNVPINGNVSGLGRVTHGEFAMATGEMSADEFEAFLATIFTHLIQHTASRIIDSICAATDTSPAIRQGEWEGGPTRSQADVHPRVWTSASGRRAVKLIGWSPNPSKSKRDRYSCRRKPNGLIRFYWSYWLSHRESMTIRSTAFLSF